MVQAMLMKPAFNPRNRLNFSGGPGVLPETVLCAVQEAVMEVPGVGLSILGISHRSDWFADVVREAETNIRSLLDLPPDYHVLFLQGGATQQFAMVPMALPREGKALPEYLETGYWSAKSIAEAQRVAPLRVLWSGRESGYRNLPQDAELSYAQDAAYLHYVSNETVEGLQFSRVLGREDVTRVCDMSSDFLSRPCEAQRFSLIYAHAQKNIGPAGVTIVLVRDEIVRQAPAGLPSCLDFRAQAQAHSIHNTPPVFAIYVVLLVTRWLLREIGGLERMDQINRAKAASLYACLDASAGYYRGWAAREDRSLMNVAFTLPTPALQHEFLQHAARAGFSGLEGHRAIGGLRASIYNALTLEAVTELCGFMADFQHRHPC